MYSLKLLPLSPDICYCLLNRVKQILCSHNIFEVLFLLQQVSVSAEGNIRRSAGCTTSGTALGACATHRPHFTPSPVYLHTSRPARRLGRGARPPVSPPTD